VRTLEAVGAGVGCSETQDLFSYTGRVSVDNGESTQGETTITNTVPVSVNPSSPPLLDLLRSIASKSLSTVVETQVDHRPHDSITLVICPVVVEPVVSNSESVDELGGVEEVTLCVPSGGLVTKWDI
jgi:hypothetical protein